MTFKNKSNISLTEDVNTATSLTDLADFKAYCKL